ncbi:DNA-dependent RNA polymerase subunit rpo18 [Squirrelpox virus]|uniref:DNA-directed RNA polymerase 18 kDa subunit n=1 Tax=Squirrelpox virus TaxID=240426 RepID=U3UBA3_9POXV|nr:DNA-dependent RNA polymerase subunit rpo18 [Squirrelpox virus]CCD83262.1 DNA-dependent RNA polymerase subunit rpo18 [Squirrelpox virus]
MSTFVRNVYLSVQLDPHDLTLNVRDNIRSALVRTYLHRETSGIMAKEIEIQEDMELPLGEIVNNHVVVRVPCRVTYKYYRVGDVVRGTLNITDESNVTVSCGDLVCRLSRESGTVSFSDSKYCLMRNGTVHENGSEVSVVLKEARAGTDTNFVFLAVLLDPANAK